MSLNLFSLFVLFWERNSIPILPNSKSLRPSSTKTWRNVDKKLLCVSQNACVNSSAATVQILVPRPRNLDSHQKLPKCQSTSNENRIFVYLIPRLERSDVFTNRVIEIYFWVSWAQRYYFCNTSMVVRRFRGRMYLFLPKKEKRKKKK